MEIVKHLVRQGVADSVVYQQIARGLDTNRIKRLPDGRITMPEYSPIQERVEVSVLEIMGRLSPAGFLSDSESVPGYGLEMVAQDLGIKPREIESEFYAVMRKLRSIAEEPGNDKKLFFEKLTGKKIGPAV